MKELLFRQAIFDPVTGGFLKWHYWGLIDNAFVGIDTGWVSPAKAVENSYQYTGLKDKNGKEGYHKDICGDPEGGRLFVIEWLETEARFVLQPIGASMSLALNLDQLRLMEVIGNVPGG